MIPTLRWINHVVRHFLLSLLLAKAPFLLIPVLAALLVLLLSYLFVLLPMTHLAMVLPLSLVVIPMLHILIPTMPIPVLVLQGMLVFAAFHFFVAIFFRTFAFPLPLAISLVFIFLILVVLYTLAMASTLVIVLARLILYPLFFLILVVLYTLAMALTLVIMLARLILYPLRIPALVLLHTMARIMLARLMYSLLFVTINTSAPIQVPVLMLFLMFVTLNTSAPFLFPVRMMVLVFLFVRMYLLALQLIITIFYLLYTLVMLVCGVALMFQPDAAFTKLICSPTRSGATTLLVSPFARCRGASSMSVWSCSCGAALSTPAPPAMRDSVSAHSRACASLSVCPSITSSAVQRSPPVRSVL